MEKRLSGKQQVFTRPVSYWSVSIKRSQGKMEHRLVGTVDANMAVSETPVTICGDFLKF